MSKSHQITIRLTEKEYEMLIENIRLQNEQVSKIGMNLEMNITKSISKALFTENHYLRGNITWKD